jgi:hypothetical protein
MKPHHVVGIHAKNGGLHVAGADHLVRHEQKLLLLHPGMFAAHSGRFVTCADCRIVVKQQVQDSHKVRLPCTETAVQVAGFAGDRIHSRSNEAQRIVKAVDKLG